MSRTVRFVWNLLLFAGDVYALVSWLRPKEGLTVPFNIGAPEYALAITLFTGGLIGVNWNWIQAKRPKNKMRDLKPLLISTYTAIAVHDVASPRGYRTPFSYLWQQVVEHCRGLGIPVPQCRKAEWLTVMIGCAETGNVRRARQIIFLEVPESLLGD